MKFTYTELPAQGNTVDAGAPLFAVVTQPKYNAAAVIGIFWYLGDAERIAARYESRRVVKIAEVK